MERGTRPHASKDGNNAAPRPKSAPYVPVSFGSLASKRQLAHRVCGGDNPSHAREDDNSSVAHVKSYEDIHV
jgi:hypothetical protein